ncbi:dehydrogenase [Burkholderia sp. Bp9140]|uniref:NAD(P)-dependent oxidoreductase n=1 Tax=Burkholderia sp. Bp9140 TaxID=2184572 RepID=UPI000F57391D|nr:NAD(P)-dependent oxidoreductase [Burkholderia sp. Bp9140]RQR51314.1 dehydrogenase [Burkholderia sp. Bp9140]
MARIFICGDTGQATLLDSVSSALRDKGHDVVRGPLNEVGVVRTYSEVERHALIDTSDIAVFTTRHACSRVLLEGARRLRGVCYPVIGVETIDLDAANELGIIVGHGAVRGNVIGMAESTIMLILMLLYDVETNIGRLRNGQWRRPRHSSRQLEGKTIGLLGYGRIAKEISVRLHSFGVRIIVTSPRTRAENLPPGVEQVELSRLFAESDVLCVLTGLTPQTRHLIGFSELGLMKPDAYLVNTARGEIIEEEALYACLDEGRIAGAALDTFAIEPLPSDSPLRTLSNVILTPHCVGHTIEGEAEFAPTMLENIQRILAGELPLYCKNPEAEPAWRRRLAHLDVENAT